MTDYYTYFYTKYINLKHFTHDLFQKTMNIINEERRIQVMENVIIFMSSNDLLSRIWNIFDLMISQNITSAANFSNTLASYLRS